MSDVFVSYAREDELEMERIRAPLSAAGHEVWIDREGIEPADRWRMSVEEAIERSDAFVFAISAHSLASDACLGELAHAEALNKKVIAICLQQSATDLAKPQILDELSWIMMRPEDDFDASVERLVHALETDLDVVRTHTRILVRARAWETAGRRVSPLLRGEELVAAEEWLSRAGLGKGPQPTDLQREFIRASRRAAARRQRTIASLSGLVAAIAIALSVFALIQRSDAITNQKLAQSRLLAAQSELSLSNDPSLSTLLALRGLAVRRTGEAEQALRDALVRLQTLVVLRGNTAPILSATFSPSGAEALTVNQSGMVQRWDVRSGAQLAAIRLRSVGELSTTLISEAAFSPDGSRLVTIAADEVARVWDVHTGAQLADCPNAPGTGAIPVSAVFGSDGSRLLVARSDGTADIYDARTGTQLVVIRATRVGTGAGILAGASFSPDGSRVLTAGDDGTARVWDARTAKLLLTLRMPKVKYSDGSIMRSGVEYMTFSPDGAEIVTGSNADVRVWNARTGAVLAVIATVDIKAAVFSPDGSELVTASGNTLASWDARTGAQLLSYDQAPGPLNAAAFSRDGSKIITAGGDGTARIWDARAGGTLGAFAAATGKFFVAAALSPDGKTLAVVGSDGSTKVLNDRTHARVSTLRIAKGALAGVSDVAFSPDGARLVTAGGSAPVQVWDARTGALLLSLSHTSVAEDASFSANGSKILVANGGEDGTARLWDSRTGARLISVGGEPGMIGVAALSPDESELLTAGMDGVARIWNARTGARLLTLKGYFGSIKDVAFSPDGSRVLTAGEGGARMWSAHTGALLLSLSGSTGFTVASFSPDGSRVLTGGEDGTVEIWSAATGTPLLSYKLTIVGVVGAQFSSDGREIMAVGGSEVWLYSTQLAGPIAPLERIARSLVTRPFTPRERKTYLAGIAG